METFSLDDPIMELASSTEQYQWTTREAVQGLFCCGGLGAGKTTGTGRQMALRFLSKKFGGLVMTAKPDEKDVWINYCKLTGREDDLIVIEPRGKYYLNFLQYEASQTDGKNELTDNLVDVLKTVIQAGVEKDSGMSNDGFWESALDMLIFNVIDLCRLAYGKVSIQEMYNIVQTIPKGDPKIDLSSDDGEIKAFDKAFQAARDNITIKIDSWMSNLSDKERTEIITNDNLENEMLDGVPEYRLLKFLDQFFIDTYITLSDKTRSIIDFTFSGFLFRLLREPVYSLFCRHDLSTVTPEDSLKGKIILINLPVKVYHKVGRDCQILFKYIWQRAMEKRNVTENSRPVFLWADEAQNFIHEHDVDFQATARSSRICTVYLTQNLPNLYASMGGKQSEYKVKSFLGTLATKIFHANADIETNRYASELIGDSFFEDQSDSITVAKNVSHTRGRSFKLERVVRPEQFISLKTGGPKNNFKVEGYMHRQGDVIMNGDNHIKMNFNQFYQP
ncbi:type IV secretory system conjugative DNA transfer family protein [Arcicella lustrica]|uniref:TraM recognition domain-containing protein n=1 Tax=Arcicella lustrica TaxID=2984196 RepID=A0ABU5SGJ8_9BACT|nr:TraM recognition domain-containing protein [Arcicella sp. DC25W]MEA5426390.1 TraM recognition domain-containing protein [Arcicella sp. DC25W]